LSQRELVLAALKGEKTFRVPVVGLGGMVNTLNREVILRAGIPLPTAHYSGEMMAELAVAARDMVGYDNLAVPLCTTVEAEILGAKIDMGGAGSLPRISAFPDYPLDRLFFNARSASISHGRIPAVLKAVELLRKMRPALPVFGNVVSPGTLLSFLARPSEILRLRERGEERLLDLLEQWGNFITIYAGSMAERGAEVIVVNDRSVAGAALGSEELVDLLLPSLIDLVIHLRNVGTRVLLHVCGDVGYVLEKLKECKADAFSFDAEVDVARASEVTEKPVVGSVRPSSINHFPPEMVLEEMLLTVRKGALLLSPPCGLGLEAPLQNLKVICEAVRYFRP
jgi:[methyl-Co(III) methanol-specific corrinoid protein]:coenzyme M methyltransferase